MNSEPRGESHVSAPQFYADLHPSSYNLRGCDQTSTSDEPGRRLDWTSLSNSVCQNAYIMLHVASVASHHEAFPEEILSLINASSISRVVCSLFAWKEHEGSPNLPGYRKSTWTYLRLHWQWRENMSSRLSKSKISQVGNWIGLFVCTCMCMDMTVCPLVC